MYLCVTKREEKMERGRRKRVNEGRKDWRIEGWRLEKGRGAMADVGGSHYVRHQLV